MEVKTNDITFTFDPSSLILKKQSVLRFDQNTYNAVYETFKTTALSPSFTHDTVISSIHMLPQIQASSTYERPIEQRANEGALLVFTADTPVQRRGTGGIAQRENMPTLKSYREVYSKLRPLGKPIGEIKSANHYYSVYGHEERGFYTVRIVEQKDHRSCIFSSTELLEDSQFKNAADIMKFAKTHLKAMKR